VNYLKVYFDKNTKEELLKYGGSYKGHASIYEYRPEINESVRSDIISIEFIAGDLKDAMFHFDKIVKHYEHMSNGHRCLHYKIDKIETLREAVNNELS
jgi:hypothetical protein